MIAVGDYSPRNFSRSLQAEGTYSVNPVGAVTPWVNFPQQNVIEPFTDASEQMGARHGQGANVVFCDDHVEYAKQVKWNEAAEPTRRRWNNDNLPHRETWFAAPNTPR
jgi:prepilin-type processing-associated H-X9-DG protein